MTLDPQYLELAKTLMIAPNINISKAKQSGIWQQILILPYTKEWHVVTIDDSGLSLFFEHDGKRPTWEESNSAMLMPYDIEGKRVSMAFLAQRDIDLILDGTIKVPKSWDMTTMVRINRADLPPATPEEVKKFREDPDHAHWFDDTKEAKAAKKIEEKALAELKKSWWHGTATVTCKKCGGTAFEVAKELEGSTQQNVEMAETMAHRGFGWVYDSFVFRCTACGSKDKTTVKVVGLMGKSKNKKGK